MAYKSTTELVQETLRRLRQVPGYQTQLYSEDIITTFLLEAYSILREEAWWPWLMRRVDTTLDATGKPAIDLTTMGLRSWGDIRAVYYKNYNQPLPMIGIDLNPTNISTGMIARYVEPLSMVDDPNQQYLFKVRGGSLGDAVGIWGRYDPDLSNVATKIPMNPVLLANYAAWRYLSDDAANPAAAALALQVYEKVKAQELERINHQPIWLNPTTVYTHDEWMER